MVHRFDVEGLKRGASEASDAIRSVLTRSRVEQLSRIIQSAGLRLPESPNQAFVPHPFIHRRNPSPPTETPATITSVGDTPIPSQEMFLNIDDDESDGDFLPQSSPRPVSDSEPSDAEGTGTSVSHRVVGKGNGEYKRKMKTCDELKKNISKMGKSVDMV